MSCSMSISVIAGSSSRSRSVSCTRSARESPAAGSSSIISLGSVARAMPTSSWRCSPWESSPTIRSSVPSRPTRSAIARARSRISVSARERTGTQVAGAHAEQREVEVVLDRHAEEQPRSLEGARQAEPGALAPRLGVTSRPNNSIDPDVGGNSPEITLNSVVLPAPLGPRMARRSPGAISRSTSRTAWTPPKRRPTPRRRRIGRRCRWLALLRALACSCRRPSRSLPTQEGVLLLTRRVSRDPARESRRLK